MEPGSPRVTSRDRQGRAAATGTRLSRWGQCRERRGKDSKCLFQPAVLAAPGKWEIDGKNIQELSLLKYTRKNVHFSSRLSTVPSLMSIYCPSASWEKRLIPVNDPNRLVP